MVEVVTESLPQPNQEALDFLQNIGRDDINACLFKDVLVNISEDGKTLGEYVVNIERVTLSGEQLLLIHASSNGKVEDNPTGSTITAYVREDLTVVQQHHHEYVKIPQHELEKNTSIKRNNETNTYSIERVTSENGGVQKQTQSIEIPTVHGFVTEGSSLLLSRLLARSRFTEDKLVFLTADVHSGLLLPTTYKPLPERSQMVRKEEIVVTGIERKVDSVDDLPSTWQSFFMDDGHLTMCVQTGSSFFAVVNLVPQKIEEVEEQHVPCFAKKPLLWEEDEELYSKFLERKEALKANYSSYLREHPDAQALLSDFFQFLLLRKPEDVVTFAANFFSLHSPVLPDRTPYLTSEQETPPADKPKVSFQD